MYRFSSQDRRASNEFTLRGAPLAQYSSNRSRGDANQPARKSKDRVPSRRHEHESKVVHCVDAPNLVVVPVVVQAPWSKEWAAPDLSETAPYLQESWSGCQDLNLRPLDPQGTGQCESALYWVPCVQASDVCMSSLCRPVQPVRACLGKFLARCRTGVRSPAAAIPSR
jgi:hypothetical protein